ncbi:MAG: Deoxyhypusine synthase-like protein [Candidatus Heimdallarchaeota archaeon LC_3]|nr:MAG: Deoxyhypusine synthase-like protein [Candidatus Heimdallarchaeota archaeon LC_3]
MVKDISQKSIDNLINEYNHSGFTAGSFGKACKVIKDMVDDLDISVFLSLSGALIPAGQQKFLVDIISSGRITGVVTTGAMLTHDYLEDLGYKHTPVDHNKSDEELRKNGINRIYDMVALDEGFEVMEKSIHDFLEKNYPSSASNQINISVPDFLFDLGKDRSERSILGICNRKNVPVYCPAITDSMLGVHIMTFREFHPQFNVDIILELKKFSSLCFDQKKTSAIVLGGGVPKNYLFQGMLLSGRELTKAVQFTMDRPEHGGLSGASLNEAISWGKIEAAADFVTVVIDVTIILPIISELFKI